MTRSKKAPGDYAVGYGKLPVHTQFRKGMSGNPGGWPAKAPLERIKMLALKEAQRAQGRRRVRRTQANSRFGASIPCFARRIPCFSMEQGIHRNELISLGDRAEPGHCNRGSRPNFRIGLCT
jgi:hypothetical protein